MRLAACVVTGCVLSFAGEAHAYCQMTTTMPIAGATCPMDGIPLAWPQGRQCLSYSVVPRESDDPSLEAIRGVVDQSFAAWMDVTCDGQPVALDLRQTLELGACPETQYNPTQPNANSVMFVQDWKDRGYDPMAFGVTLVWHDPTTGEILDADIQINEHLGRLTICEGTCPPRASDIQNVVTHEIGHYLGLGHSSVRLSTMAPNAPLGETGKRTLHDDDREGLCAIYGSYPVVACEDADFQPDNGFGPDCYTEEFNSCGCSVPGRRNAPSLLGGLMMLLLVVVAGLRRFG